MWASGKHGGPRLFHATPESVHVLFLRQDSGYLHTVGDYPAYDLEVNPRHVQSFIDTWQAGYYQGADLLERIAAVRLKTVFESLKGDEVVQIWELTSLTSREFVTVQLSNLCTTLTNQRGRTSACTEYQRMIQN